MQQSVIHVENLAYAIPEAGLQVQGISFRLKPRQILAITGPNGSGKSTLLRALSGKLRLTRGTIELAPGTRVGVLPQMVNSGFHLPLTLADVLQISLGREATLQKALAWGLLDREHFSLGWNTASGGEKKRTLMTRLLLQAPSLLLLDEPLNHLDRDSRQRVKQAIARFLSDAEAGNRAAILVSHEPFLDDDLEAFEGQHLALGGSTDLQGGRADA